MVVSCLGPSNPSHHLLPLDRSPSSSATLLPSPPPASPRAWPKMVHIRLHLPSRVSVNAQLFLPPDLDRTEVTQYPLVVILPSKPNAHQVARKLRIKCLIFHRLLAPTGAPIQQDHQRWRYNTVIHLEHPVYLAIREDLKKERKKEQR